MPIKLSVCSTDNSAPGRRSRRQRLQNGTSAVAVQGCRCFCCLHSASQCSNWAAGQPAERAHQAVLEARSRQTGQDPRPGAVAAVGQHRLGLRGALLIRTQRAAGLFLEGNGVLLTPCSTDFSSVAQCSHSQRRGADTCSAAARWRRQQQRRQQPAPCGLVSLASQTKSMADPRSEDTHKTE